MSTTNATDLEVENWKPPVIPTDGSADYSDRHWVQNDCHDVFTNVLQPIPHDLRDLVRILDRDFQWCDYDTYVTYSYGHEPGVGVYVSHADDIVHINIDPNTDAEMMIYGDVMNVVDWVVELLVQSDKYEGSFP